MRRAIQRLVEDRLALDVLEGKVRAGDNVAVSAKLGEVVLTVAKSGRLEATPV
jgi:ATP-dependent Clp protease ATP-binding subunit ClpA